MTPFAYSLAEAIERDDVRRAYEFIRAGQDPNDLIAVRHPVLTAGQGVLVSPLLWSVASNRADSMRMLLGQGARMERAGQSRRRLPGRDARPHRGGAFPSTAWAGTQSLSQVCGHRRGAAGIPVCDQRGSQLMLGRLKPAPHVNIRELWVYARHQNCTAPRNS